MATQTIQSRQLVAFREALGGTGIYEGNQMRARQKVAKNIDAYIARFPDEVHKILKKIRMTIRKAAPQAQETISYQIRPSF